MHSQTRPPLRRSVFFFCFFFFFFKGAHQRIAAVTLSSRQRRAGSAPCHRRSDIRRGYCRERDARLPILLQDTRGWDVANSSRGGFFFSFFLKFRDGQVDILGKRARRAAHYYRLPMKNPLHTQ